MGAGLPAPRRPRRAEAAMERRFNPLIREALRLGGYYPSWLV